jgi:biopolymer transport protein ExbB/TolQ
MMVFLAIYSIVITILLIVGVYVLKRVIDSTDILSDAVEDINTQIEESLDILDSSYQTLSTAASTEVMSDEPLVRHVVSAIGAARLAVGTVAVKLSSVIAEEEVDDTDKAQDE